MKKPNWRLLLAVSLIIASVAVYLTQVILFHRKTETLFYLFQDLAFLPVQVLIVTLIINEILRKREAELLKYKLNMVIGAFFSAIGNELLEKFLEFEKNSPTLADNLQFNYNWNAKDFALASNSLSNHNYEIDCRSGDLNDLKFFLSDERQFLMRLLENPNLLEHESFTDLLWATSHLSEELDYRCNLDSLTEEDLVHLAGDIKRAHRYLLLEWLSYVKHLSEQYPYMYSLMVRSNPLTAKCINNSTAFLQ